MQWFRLYHEILDDPKILELSWEFRWHFLGILCCASENPDRGILPNLRRIAIRLRMGEARARRIVARFIELGFIDANEDGTVLKVHGWDQRQFKSDDITARTQAAKERSRERSRKAAAERFRNVPGNADSRARARVQTSEGQREETALPCSESGGKASREGRAWTPAEYAADRAEKARLAACRRAGKADRNGQA